MWVKKSVRIETVLLIEFHDNLRHSTMGGLLVTDNLVTNILVTTNLATNILVTNNLVTEQFDNWTIW